MTTVDPKVAAVFFPEDASPQPVLTVEVARRSDDVAVVVLTGDLDRETAADMQAAVTRLLEVDRPHVITFDMSGTTFLDSSGIRALLTCRNRADEVNVRIEIDRAHDMVRQVLTVTELLDILRVSP